MGIHADKLRMAEDVYDLARKGMADENGKAEENDLHSGFIRIDSKEKRVKKREIKKTEAEADSSKSSSFQKRKMRKKAVTEHVKAKNAAATGRTTEKTGGLARNIEKRISSFVRAHAGAFVTAGLITLLILLISSVFTSCQSAFSGSGGAVWISTYTAEDSDIRDVESRYVQMEEELKERVTNIESEYPGYDEYVITDAETCHDPYKLASLLTVLYEDYSADKIGTKLQEIFDRQYELTINPVTEIRTRTVTSEYTDPETGSTSTDTYEEEYEYHILYGTLVNNSIDAAVQAENLDADQTSRYQVLNETYGNKKEVFGDNIYAVATDEKDLMEYDIPAEALTDTKFARMIRTAEQCLGVPYVWGGYTMSGFDCSGFVSYVLNHCGNGWNYGRLTANGLLSQCDRISLADAEPGDLIFFEKTYDVAGASHVGIYVGNGMMIHCGKPVQYTTINTAYWQEHYLCCGRLK